jgi:hypothetical protein
MFKYAKPYKSVTVNQNLEVFSCQCKFRGTFALDTRLVFWSDHRRNRRLKAGKTNQLSPRPDDLSNRQLQSDAEGDQAPDGERRFENV